MTKSKTSQGAPTRPQLRDENGRALDAHGLPINGPARAAALRGKADPALAEAETAADAPTSKE